MNWAERTRDQIRLLPGYNQGLKPSDLENKYLIQEQLLAMIQKNNAFRKDPSVTTAELIAQTKALSLQMNQLIRWSLLLFDGID